MLTRDSPSRSVAGKPQRPRALGESMLRTEEVATILDIAPGKSAEALYDLGSFLSQPLAEDHVRQGDVVILNEQGLSSTISSSARSKVTSAVLDGQFLGRVPAKTKKKCYRPS
jgi:hypothetical protein